MDIASFVDKKSQPFCGTKESCLAYYFLQDFFRNGNVAYFRRSPLIFSLRLNIFQMTRVYSNIDESGHALYTMDEQYDHGGSL